MLYKKYNDSDIFLKYSSNICNWMNNDSNFCELATYAKWTRPNKQWAFFSFFAYPSTCLSVHPQRTLIAWLREILSTSRSKAFYCSLKPIHFYLFQRKERALFVAPWRFQMEFQDAIKIWDWEQETRKWKPDISLHLTKKFSSFELIRSCFQGDQFEKLVMNATWGRSHASINPITIWMKRSFLCQFQSALLIYIPTCYYFDISLNSDSW